MAPDRPDTPASDHPDTPASDHPDTPASDHPDTPASDHPDTPASDHPDTPASDPDGVRASLRRLADADERTVIERATTATRDLAAAAEFVEATGLGELEAAIETVEDPDLASRGERALAAFTRFREAADGPDGAGDHFHPGRRTDLRRDDEPSSR